jgi:Ca2+-binding RTX toxin-like protein
LIKIQNILTLAVIISLILPLQYNTLKFANGEMQTDSTLVIYNDNNSKNPVLADSKNTILKPKVDVFIEGTLNDDQLKGGSGDDKISGEDGYDTILGGEGNDKINGGKGDDIINGESGNDTLKGGSGDDKISGEGGNDLIDGGKGDDKLLGGKGDDGILGGEGNDVLNGGEGVDIMAGGSGNDTFICDRFDTIIDFNLTEGDRIVGECSSLNQTQEIEKSFDNNPQEDFRSALLSPPQQLPQFSNQNNPQEDFQLGSSPPFNPNNIPPEEFKLPPPLPP